LARGSPEFFGKVSDLVRAWQPDGRHPAKLIEQHGHRTKLFEWVDELAATCPRQLRKNMNVHCYSTRAKF
jgi:hypothetical protein